MAETTPKTEDLKRYRAAAKRRQSWDALLSDAFDYALPEIQVSFGAQTGAAPGKEKRAAVYDSTAPDALEERASRTMDVLFPDAVQWLVADPRVKDADAELFARAEDAFEKFDRAIGLSNFHTEAHPALMEAYISTGALSLDFGDARQPLVFTAVTIGQLAPEEGPDGVIRTAFRNLEMRVRDILGHWPRAKLPDKVTKPAETDPDHKVRLIECNLFDAKTKRTSYRIYLAEGELKVLDSPLDVPRLVVFRVGKAAGETMGRGPVIKALPDIKTANKVVELVLKNATIAVTGIWQADDDGVLNPATVKLTPGTIIPKAVGSAGLQPLSAPGKFDVSELVLEKLQERIERIIKGPSLPPVAGGVRSATETLERRADQQAVELPSLRRLFGELYFPVVRRGLYVLTDPRLAGTDLHVEPFETVGGFGGEDAKPDRMATVDALMGAVLSPADMMQQNVQAQKALSAAIALGQIYGGMQNVPEIDHPAFRRTFLEQSGLESDLLTDPDAEPETGAQAAQAAEALSALAGGGAGGGQPAATDPLAGLLSGAGVAGHG